jgi:hypothetical protein
VKGKSRPHSKPICDPVVPLCYSGNRLRRISGQSSVDGGQEPPKGGGGVVDCLTAARTLCACARVDRISSSGRFSNKVNISSSSCVLHVFTAWLAHV